MSCSSGSIKWKQGCLASSGCGVQRTVKNTIPSITEVPFRICWVWEVCPGCTPRRGDFILSAVHGTAFTSTKRTENMLKISNILQRTRERNYIIIQHPGHCELMAFHSIGREESKWQMVCTLFMQQTVAKDSTGLQCQTSHSLFTEIMQKTRARD